MSARRRVVLYILTLTIVYHGVSIIAIIIDYISTIYSSIVLYRKKSNIHKIYWFNAMLSHAVESSHESNHLDGPPPGMALTRLEPGWAGMMDARPARHRVTTVQVEKPNFAFPKRYKCYRISMRNLRISQNSSRSYHRLPAASTTKIATAYTTENRTLNDAL